MPGTGRPPAAPAYVAATGLRAVSAPAASAFVAVASAAIPHPPGGGLAGEVSVAGHSPLPTRLAACLMLELCSDLLYFYGGFYSLSTSC